jgi:hypothetical protein
MTLSIADRFDIIELLARADSAASQRDAELYVSYFTDDVVLDGDMGEHRSKEVLRQSVGPIWQSEGLASVHLTLNPTVEPIVGVSDRAVAKSVLVILKEGATISVYNVSSIIQHVVKTNGVWLIERRTVSSMRQDPEKLG